MVQENGSRLQYKSRSEAYRGRVMSPGNNGIVRIVERYKAERWLEDFLRKDHFPEITENTEKKMPGEEYIQSMVESGEGINNFHYKIYKNNKNKNLIKNDNQLIFDGYRNPPRKQDIENKTLFIFKRIWNILMNYSS